MCGQIRRTFELNLTVAELLDLRNEGLIEGIVVSTWKDEIDSVPGLRRKFEELNIVMVENDPIEEVVGSYIEIGFARQALQLRTGIEATPDDVFILKCRTDYSHDKIRGCREVLEGDADLTLGTHGSLDFGLNYKIAVFRLSSHMPFGFLDAGFLGYKTDVKKMTKMDMVRYRYGYLVMVDFMWFLNLFNDEYPIIDDCLMLMKRYMTVGDSNGITRLELNEETFELPGMFNKFFALYLVLLGNCFYLLGKSNYAKVDEQLSLLDIVQGKKSAGMLIEWLCQYRNPLTIQKVLQGDIKKTRGYLKLYSEILRFASNEYAHKCNVTRQDYEETRIWLRDVARWNVEAWMRPFNKEPDSATMGMNFENTLKCINDSKTIYSNDELLYLMHYVVYGKRNWFYGRLLEILDVVEARFPEIYHEVVATAGRTENVYLLRKIAKSLEKEPKGEYNNFISMVYIRREKDPWWSFFSNLDANKVAAFYSYSLYEEAIGKNSISRLFYKNLCNWLGETEQTEVCIYSNEYKKIIKNYIVNNYDKQEEKVKQLVDFWIDECDLSELGEDVRQYYKLYRLERLCSRSVLKTREEAFDRILDIAGNTIDVSEVELLYQILMENLCWVTEKQLEKINRIVDVWKANNLLNSGLIERVRIGESVTIEEVSNELSTLLRKEQVEKAFALLNVLQRTDKKYLYKEIAENCEFSTRAKRILRIYSIIADNERLRMFMLRNGNEIWMEYKFGDAAIAFEKKYLQIPRDINGCFWPCAKNSVESSYAMCVRVSDKELTAGIEFVSIPTLAKSYVFKELSNEFSLDEQSFVSRLSSFNINVESEEKYEDAVHRIVHEFVRIGEKLEAIYADVQNSMN